VRYDGEHFPEDLTFQETKDRQNFQGRYIMQQPFTGAMTCPAARDYARSVRERREKEIATVASLTGWTPEVVRQKSAKDPLPVAAEPTPAASPAWWKGIWK
jgi:hypothetical protein